MALTQEKSLSLKNHRVHTVEVRTETPENALDEKEGFADYCYYDDSNDRLTGQPSSRTIPSRSGSALRST